MQSTIRPAYLKKGDAIGIVAPARAVTEDEIKPFSDLVEGAGLRVIYGKYLFHRDNQFSGTVTRRVNDLHQVFSNPEVKAVIAARGGYGSAQLLPYIDWNIIRDNPKWFIGFSDTTAIHAAFNRYVSTIHGVMPYSFQMKEPQSEKSFSNLLELLKGKDMSYEVADHPLNYEGKAEGEITGGNLSVLYSLSGTPYEPDYEGKILLLEDVDEYRYHIDRMLLNFEMRGIFSKINGLLVGSFSDMHDNEVPFGKEPYEMLADYAIKYRIPALFNFPSGHKKSNLPLIFGLLSTLSSKKRGCSLKMY